MVFRLLVPLVICLVLVRADLGQTTAFVFQGELETGGGVSNGNFDFEFSLFDSISEGNQIGSMLLFEGVPVVNGRFTVNLDFGNQFGGTNRFLQIKVREAGSGSFVTLSPRKAILSTPYSIRSLQAVTAETANLAATSTNFTGPLTGDVTGNQQSTSVTKIRGIQVDQMPPANGQVLVFDSGNNRWSPATITAGGAAPSDYLFLYRTGTPTIAPDTWQDVTFESAGPLNGWSYTIGDAVFTPGQSGLYLITFSAVLSSANATRGRIRLLRNGTEVPGGAGTGVNTGVSRSANFGRTLLATFSSGDAVKLQFFCDSADCSLSGAADTGIPGVSITITKVR